MPCIQPESSLHEFEMKLILNVVNEQQRTSEEIAEQTKQPLFKMRSALREMVQLNYIEEIGNKYTISTKGKVFI